MTIKIITEGLNSAQENLLFEAISRILASYGCTKYLITRKIN